jgi:hypothetical protein
MLRRYLPRITLALVSLFCTYVVVEVAWRIGRYRKLEAECLVLLRQESDSGSGSADDMLLQQIHLLRKYSVFDPHTGFRYKPHVQVDLVAPGSNLSPRRWQTNGHGHVSRVDYPVAKPADEFRIAVIGDSFAAGVTNSVRWPDVLEERLSASPGWSKCVPRKTRVINLGRDGIGVVQFKDVFEQEAAGFAPDLVVVNLILDDLHRRPYYRGLSQPAASQQQTARHMIREKYLDPLPWYGLYPELLAGSLLGPRLGLQFHLDPQLARLYATVDESVQCSLAALRSIVRQHPRVLILHQPQHEELDGTLGQRHAALRRRFYEEGAELGIIRMIEKLQVPADLSRWYQLPSDGHPSDAGMIAYGSAVAAMLVQTHGSPVRGD